LNFYLFMIVINHQYLKLQVEFRNILKVVCTINSAMLNSKILLFQAHPYGWFSKIRSQMWSAFAASTDCSTREYQSIFMKYPPNMPAWYSSLSCFLGPQSLQIVSGYLEWLMFWRLHRQSKELCSALLQFELTTDCLISQNSALYFEIFTQYILGNMHGHSIPCT